MNRTLIILIALIICFQTISAELRYEELLFVPWGEAAGELGLVTAPGENYGPPAFSVNAHRIAILDGVHQKMNYYGGGYYDYSMRLPFRNIDDFLLVSETELWLLADNSVSHYVRGNIEDRFSVDNPRHMITGILPGDRSSRVDLLINHSSRLMEDLNRKGRYILFKGVPMQGEDNFIRVLKNGLTECEVRIGGKTAFKLAFERLALSRYLGKTPAGNLYLYIEEYRHNDPYKVDRTVLMVDRQGQILAEILIPRMTHHYMFRDFFVDNEGKLYKMLSSKEGIYVTAWYPEDERMTGTEVYSFPEKFADDYHYSDPPPQMIPDSSDTNLYLPDSLGIFPDSNDTLDRNN